MKLSNKLLENLHIMTVMGKNITISSPPSINLSATVIHTQHATEYKGCFQLVKIHSISAVVYSVLHLKTSDLPTTMRYF